MNGQKILCVIPARGGSKGVHRKNIRDLAGKPLLYWTIKAAQDSGIFDRIVVSTEDAEIAEVAKGFEVEIVQRPAELAEDKTLTEPVMLHVLDELEKQGYIPDYISLIQATSPFLTPEVVRNVAEKLLESGKQYDSCSTYYKPHYTFKWKKTDDDFFVSEYPVMSRPRRQDLNLEYPYSGAGACYIISTELFKKTGNRYGGNGARIGGVEIEEQDALQIDSEYDLFIADQLMRQKLKNKTL